MFIIVESPFKIRLTKKSHYGIIVIEKRASSGRVEMLKQDLDKIATWNELKKLKELIKKDYISMNDLMDLIDETDEEFIERVVILLNGRFK